MSVRNRFQQNSMLQVIQWLAVILLDFTERRDQTLVEFWVSFFDPISEPTLAPIFPCKNGRYQQRTNTSHQQQCPPGEAVHPLFRELQIEQVEANQRHGNEQPRKPAPAIRASVAIAHFFQMLF